MKTPDVDRIRCEKQLTLAGFLKCYNEDLPSNFPQASAVLLREFRRENGALFKSGSWSLDQHRKKMMDWLPVRLKRLEEPSA